MKKLIFSLLIIFAVYACNNANSNTNISAENNNAEEQPTPAKPTFYGEKITEEGAITGKELKEKMGNAATYDAKIKGEVVDVCKKEGCWMNIDMEDGTTMQVNMQGHSFFVPKDISGRMAIVQGTATMDTTTVEDLRHYAEDAGKSKEEISAITEPEVKLVFEANGVIIK